VDGVYRGAMEAGRSELILCTRNRPEEVRTLLAALHNCPDAPATLVVDSSETIETQTAVEDFIAVSSHPPLRYLAAPRGLTVQRMMGVRSLSPTTCIVHFLDDDAIPEPGYFSAIERAMASERGVIGVGGVDTNALPHRATRMHRFFLLHSKRPGALLRSGINVQVGAVSQITPVDWLSGCCMSYRREVFSSESFDTRLLGGALGEDVDFSFRARRLGSLCVTPHARVEHKQSPLDRMSRDAWLAAEVARRHAFVVGSGAGGTSRVAFWWSVVGDLLMSFGTSIFRGRRSSARRGVAVLKGALSVRRR